MKDNMETFNAEKYIDMSGYAGYTNVNGKEVLTHVSMDNGDRLELSQWDEVMRLRIERATAPKVENESE